MKKVSIVVINYNDKIRVIRAIESAINQTYKNTEVIIVDDGSDDETRALYKPYSGTKLIQLERDDVTARTPSRARNAGIKEATGEYICFLDSDNYYDTTFVEMCMKDIKDIAFVNWQIVGKQTLKVNVEQVWDFQQPILQNYLQFQHLDHQCLLIKKALVEQVGCYDERLPRSQDCDLIVRLIMADSHFQHVQKYLFTFEKHEDDQQKQVASIHGKALWSLKNNLNLGWMAHFCRDVGNILSIKRAIEDFTTLDVWKKEFNKSEFKAVFDEHSKKLCEEISEQSNS
jgi:glycosyltransferase involved in cell wall biosynthesis